jgi:prepilin-type N-terminal cleavage/methylation domain-containing protein
VPKIKYSNLNSLVQGHRSKRRLKRGFTLTEIIILLAVVGIFISGIIPLFLNVIQVNKSAEYHSKAYKIVDTKLESLRSGDFENITSQTSNISELPNGSLIVASSDIVDGAPQPDIKKVLITVRWNFNRDQSVKIESFITRNGITK